MAWLTLAMALARAAAGQVQLGDDDDREARRAAVIAEMDSRLATVGEITRRVQPGISRGGVYSCSGSRGRIIWILCIMRSIQLAPSRILYYTY